MNWHVALLYSVVLTAERRMKSAELIQIAEAAGCKGPKTVLSTGNLIFQDDRSEYEIESALEHAVLGLLGKPIPVFVRHADQWRGLVAANPFPAETAIDPSRVAVRIMRQDPDPAIITRIASSVAVGERFTVTPRALWLASSMQLSTSALLRAISAKWAGEGTLRSASALAKITAALGD